MTYTHLTINEITLIESYEKQKLSVKEIANRLSRSLQPIYNVVNFLRKGHNAKDYLQRYQSNKKNCGRKHIVFTDEEKKYVQNKLELGWNPEVILGRNEKSLPCCSRTLYRMFEKGIFKKEDLPMQGKRKPNGHKEKRGKQSYLRSIHTRKESYPEYDTEFGHLEGDTIVGVHHKSAIITLVERLSKVIIAIKPKGRKAKDIEESITEWQGNFSKNTFKSITFDCGKEFSNWKNISNETDMDIYFADPGTPSQRGLNENSNGLLRRNGLPKEMDFRNITQTEVSICANKRNNIPRKSLNYRTPVEVFMDHVSIDDYIQMDSL
jgi:IS30 family transposase